MVNTAKKFVHKGGCHCGAVRFLVKAPADVEITMCNCSICAASGFQHLIVPDEDFEMLSGEEALTTYTFNTGAAKHTFCKICGVKSFYKPRSHPDGVSVNFRCLEQAGFDSVHYIPFDGRNWEDNVVDLRKKGVT